MFYTAEEVLFILSNGKIDIEAKQQKVVLKY